MDIVTGHVWGADVAQLRMLAQSFGQTSETLLQQSTALTAAINNNTSWKGADSARFTSEWNGSHRALIQQTARALKQQSKQLLTQADEQEKASNAKAGSGGGPLGPLGHGAGAWAVVGGGAAAGGVATIRSIMGIHKNIKAPFTLAKHLGQYGWVLKNERDALSKAFFTSGRHRVGGPGFTARNLLRSDPLKKLLTKSTESSKTIGLIDKASDIASLKDLNKHLPGLSRLAPLLEERQLFGAGKSWDWLGKSGLSRTLGWAGVGFNAVDTVKNFSEGKLLDGAASLGKTMLGVGCFMPPPAGTICQVASVGVAIYENWDTITSVGKNVGEGIANAVKDPGKFVSDAADRVTDAGKSVAHFFGF
ncbi:WXG100 family type VII secretion target [Pseudarthrobacter sp. L19]|uniref:WXG100 family type VII secretion target n=1 Tax=Pseudarthrobacter sp. L19 TaxID=3423951 RepID=UPI003D78C1E8